MNLVEHLPGCVYASDAFPDGISGEVSPRHDSLVLGQLFEEDAHKSENGRKVDRRLRTAAEALGDVPNETISTGFINVGARSLHEGDVFEDDRIRPRGRSRQPLLVVRTRYVAFAPFVELVESTLSQTEENVK